FACRCAGTRVRTSITLASAVACTMVILLAWVVKRRRASYAARGDGGGMPSPAVVADAEVGLRAVRHLLGSPGRIVGQLHGDGPDAFRRGDRLVRAAAEIVGRGAAGGRRGHDHLHGAVIDFDAIDQAQI